MVATLVATKAALVTTLAITAGYPTLAALDVTLTMILAILDATSVTTLAMTLAVLDEILATTLAANTASDAMNVSSAITLATTTNIFGHCGHCRQMGLNGAHNCTVEPHPMPLVRHQVSLDSAHDGAIKLYPLPFVRCLVGLHGAHDGGT